MKQSDTGVHRRRRQGGKVTPTEGRHPPGAAEGRDDRQADPGSEVEEPSQHERPAGWKQELGQRRARSEEHGRPEATRHTSRWSTCVDMPPPGYPVELVQDYGWKV